MKKVYIAGKITGQDNFEELFEIAEKEIETMGYIPVSPTKLEHYHDKTWNSYMRECIKSLVTCDTIYLLSNWMESRGARAEFEIANILELTVLEQNKKMPVI